MKAGTCGKNGKERYGGAYLHQLSKNKNKNTEDATNFYKKVREHSQ